MSFVELTSPHRRNCKLTPGVLFGGLFVTRYLALRLILTRLAAGLAVACVAALLLVAGGVAWFTLQGRAVPLIAILQSLALGAIVLAAMLAIMSAVVTMLPTVWGFLGVLGILALAIPNSYVVSAPARGDVPWLGLGAYVVAFDAAVMLTLSWVRTREY